MATTQTVMGANLLSKHSDKRAEIYIYEVEVLVTGTYLTASKPNFDMLAALQNINRQLVTAVSIPPRGVGIATDYYDETTRYTAPDAQIVLSSTGNKVVTFRVDSGATNGAAGAEIADATALNGIFRFLVRTEVTKASS